VKITIVGAGIVGCAVAYELASRGAQVRVIDMRGTGAGATQASAGILAPYVEGHIDPLLRMGVRSLSMYDEFIARVIRDSGRPIEYERSGTLQVALDDAGVRGLDEDARRFARDGVEHTLLGPDDVQRIEPSLSSPIRAGLLLAQHGYVRVAQLTDALATAAARRGTAFIAGVVGGIESHGGVVTLAISQGTIESDAVILAAGSWTSALVQPLAAPPTVRPVRGQLVHLRFSDRPLARVVWGPSCYLVPWRDGSVLVGATVEDVGFDESATVAGVSGLLRAGARLLTAAPDARFDSVRVGLRPGTPDELPLIGPSSTQPGVYYAAGHYRNGILLAPLSAALVADLVLDGRQSPELALVKPDRFGL